MRTGLSGPRGDAPATMRQGIFGVDENIACELEHGRDVRLVDRRRAAAYVGVTAGRFEQLVRDNVVPPPVMVDNKRRWPIALLDVADLDFVESARRYMRRAALLESLETAAAVT